MNFYTVDGNACEGCTGEFDEKRCHPAVLGYYLCSMHKEVIVLRKKSDLIPKNEKPTSLCCYCGASYVADGSVWHRKGDPCEDFWVCGNCWKDPHKDITKHSKEKWPRDSKAWPEEFTAKEPDKARHRTYAERAVGYGEAEEKITKDTAAEIRAHRNTEAVQHLYEAVLNIRDKEPKDIRDFDLWVIAKAVDEFEALECDE